jgi:hypothetical protein
MPEGVVWVFASNRHLLVDRFGYPFAMNPAKMRRVRVWAFAFCILLSAWQAYAGFDSMFDPVVSEIGGKFGWVWLLSGPVSFFAATSIGTIFAYIAQATKPGLLRKFWSLLLWLAKIWLAGGALLFAWADWFGTSFGFTIGERTEHFLAILLPMIAVAFGFWTIERDIEESTFKLAMESVAASDGARSSLWRETILVVFRWIGALLAAGGSIAAVAVSGLLLLLWGCEPPSVTTLADRFPGERRNLETIIAMSDQDSQMAVIDPSWLEIRGQSFPLLNNAAGISAKRWDEYRRIFRLNGFTLGIRRYSAKGDAFIIVKSIGLLDNGYSSGYLYCAPGMEHQYAPCSSEEKRGERPASAGVEAYEFVKLTDRWRAFLQGPG